MLRSEAHLRAAQREAATYPTEVHVRTSEHPDGYTWQFWCLSAETNHRGPIAWYTDGQVFRLFTRSGIPAERDAHQPAHDGHWRRRRVKNPKGPDGQEIRREYSQASLDYGFPEGVHDGLRMADEKVPPTRDGVAGAKHPLFPEAPNHLRLSPTVRAALWAEYQGMRVPRPYFSGGQDTPEYRAQAWAEWERKVRELGEHLLKLRRLRDEFRGER